MMAGATYWATIRDDAPGWVAEHWPEEIATYWDECGPVDIDDLPSMNLPHQWTYRQSRMAGTPLRQCDRCGTTETYWEHDDDGGLCVRDLRPYVDRWELVASYDHGLRCADETMVCEIATLASIIMRPVLAYMIGADDYATDPYAAACDEVGYDGNGWADDVEGSERITWLHESVVWYRSYDACPDVIVETSADAGMTRFLVRANEDGS